MADNFLCTFRFWLLTALLGLCSPAAFGQAPELAALRKQMAALEHSLGQDLAARDREQNQLRELETRQAQLNRELRQLRREQQQAARDLQTLETRQAEITREHRRQLDWLTRTARIGYLQGKEDGLRLALNQQNPATIARLLQYQHYFQQARHLRASEIRQQLEELLTAARATEAARQQLAAKQEKLQQQQEQLASSRQQRQQTLSSIQSRIKTNQGRLEQLKQDEARLNRVVQQVRQAARDVPVTTGQPFGSLANKLPWPVTRRISASFNSVREGSIRWNGVLLKAEQGSPVRAIHPGRVVFASWLRGYGLLIIVDHGNNYLTLYGHNQTLEREVGEWVATGDVLARVGDSGGQGQQGLYFEIRQNGNPVNPDRWCNSRVTLPPLAQH